MKVYIIYKFNNKQNVEEVISDINSKVASNSGNKKIYFFKFSSANDKTNWKKYAKEKIKEANIVLFFDSIDENTPHRNLKWELDVAEKLKKKIVVVKQNNQKLSKKLYHYDYAENELTPGKYKKVELEKLASYLISEANWSMKQSLIKSEEQIAKDLNAKNSEKYYDILLQQYKIMIDTSERLMERRLNTSNLYTTLCSTLLTLSSASLAVSFDISGIVFFVAGLIIFFLSLNWSNLLVSYEMNNAGKYEVINNIECNLPANMFDCEYRYNTFNGIKSYSSREKQLPQIFMVLGLIATVAGIIIFFAF